MLLSEILEEATANHGQEQAVICGETRYNYSDLRNRVDRLAVGLAERGLGSLDRMAIVHRNCHHFLEAYFAVARIGAVLVPINCRLTVSDITCILENSGSKAIIVEGHLLEMVRPALEEDVGLELVVVTGEPHSGMPAKGVLYDELIKGDRHELPKPDIGEDDMSHLYYTSGTTGRPKGVILTHRNNYVHAVNAVEEIQLSGEDNWLHVSPMYHLADAWSTWAITMVGGTHLFVPEFNAERVLRTIESDRATISNFIPVMLTRIVNHPDAGTYDLNSFRLVMSGGAPIAPEVIRKVIETFDCDYIQTYGLTETSPYLTMSILKDHLKELPYEERLEYLATAGRPFKDVHMKVIGENGEEVAPDDREVGEIVAKGETISPGYWELPEETERRIVDGWLHTRDLATVNSEGYVTIVDRMDDMIISGGENVYSIEVENVLIGHPKVSEAAVIGVDDEEWGERIVSVIVPKGEEPTESELIDYCKKELASFKVPKQFILTDIIPMTTSGKIKKNVLREKYGKTD
jgi:acyl-CoA synthetase (AMP-forming)/AMP-acid ligase II